MPANTLTVRDLMATRVVTIGMDDTLKTARGVFNRRRFHHLIVLEKGKPVGVLSDRDLLKHISPFVGAPLGERPQDAATLKKRVHQMMTRKLVAVDPDASAAEAALRMEEHDVSCLPVIDADARLIGIITVRDMVRWVVAKESDATLSA